MKKIVLSMIVAAAALVGCQKSEEFAVGTTVSLSAELSQPAVSRTALVENDGVYSAVWKSGDKLSLFELADGAYTLYESNALAEDAATASFTFEGVAVKQAASFRYVAGTNITSRSTVNNLRLELPSTQAPATMSTFDGAADMLLSRPIDRASQPVSEALTFSTARVSSVVKIAVRNLALAEGEKVEKVVFSCNQPIAGLFQVGVDDLEEGKYPVPFSLKEEAYSISIILPEQQSGDFVTYFSALPATLKAGESYKVELTLASGVTLVKQGKLAADLALKAGEIVSVTVNMGDAATKTKVENLNEEYQYAIGYTTVDGATYLLDRTAVTTNPVGGLVTDLGLKINANGSIEGEVPAAYLWNFSKTAEGALQFYYVTGKGKQAHLIACNKLQGIAIQSADENGVYNARYTSEGQVYQDYFTVEEKEGGYYMNMAGARYLDYQPDNQGLYRFVGNTKESATGVVNFYRVQKAAEEVKQSLYPVVKEVASLTEGTYVILHCDANGAYNALATTPCAASAVATPAADVEITIEDNAVTAANIKDEYKWIVTHKVEEGDAYFQMRAWVAPAYWLWFRDNGTGMAVAVDRPSGNHNAKWYVVDHEMGLNMYGINAKTRYAVVNSGAWGTLSAPNGSLVFVKLSDSTEGKSAE